MEPSNVKLVMYIVPRDAKGKVSTINVTNKNLLTTADQVKVLKSTDEYRIVMEDHEFKKVDCSNVIHTLESIFAKNMPDATVTFNVRYDFDSASYDPECGAKFMELHNVMHGIDTGASFVCNPDADNVDDVADMIGMEVGNDFDLFGSDDSDVDNEEYDPFEDLVRQYKKASNKKRRKKYDNRSRVYRNCKNPKRDAHRHGVLVAADKRDIKTDEHVIKDFLEDFIPGNAGWKKDFRSDVAKRWIQSYTVSRKQLKRLERDHRKSKSSRKASKATKEALDFTRRTLTVPIDRWNDISR